MHAPVKWHGGCRAACEVTQVDHTGRKFGFNSRKLCSEENVTEETLGFALRGLAAIRSHRGVFRIPRTAVHALAAVSPLSVGVARG